VNTKHKRAVVALVVAIATLATMGFRAPHDDSQKVSILPAETCDVLGSYTALDLLSVLDEPCYAAMLDEVEHEVSKGVAASASTRALIDGILERSRAAGPWSDELLEPSYAGQASLAPRSRSFSDWGLSETDLAEIELDRGWNSAADVQSLIDSIYGKIQSGPVSYDEFSEEW
jgi:hypothetical protein